MKAKPNDYSRQYLRKERLQCELSVKALAERVGVVPSTIIGYENGSFRPSVNLWRRLKEVLGIDTWRTPEPEKVPEPTMFRFEVRRSYSIVDSGLKAHQNETISPPTGELCVFVCKCKYGIHHVFTEASGGWTRTYMDAQLIGKLIEEALT